MSQHPLVGVVLVLGHVVGMLGVAIGSADVAGHALPDAVRAFGPEVAAVFSAAAAGFVGVALGRRGRSEAMMLAMLAMASYSLPRALAPAVLLLTAWAATNLLTVTSRRRCTCGRRRPQSTRTSRLRTPPSGRSGAWAR